MDLVNYWKNAIAPWLRAKAHADSERGAALVEYALLVALIAVVCIVAISFIGTKASGTFDSVGSKLPG
jgi:pilus assembly protein Flp/PilA